MALFQPKNPDTKLTSAIARRSDIEARLKAAEVRVTDARNVAHGLARDGADDRALDVAEAALRAAQDRVGTLTAALADIRRDVAALEAEAAAIADKKMRAATAVEIEKIAASLQEAGADFIEAAARLADISGRAGVVVADATALANYCAGAAGEVPAAVDMVGSLLRNRAAATIAGSAPAAMPSPAAPPPKLTVVASEPTEEVFLIKNAKYRGNDGKTICLGSHRRHVLPVKIARRALAVNAALPLSDKRCADLQGLHGMIQPNADACLALDDGTYGNAPAPKAAGPAPVLHSAFEPHPNVGKPFTMRVPVQPVEPLALAAGARSMSDDDEE
jgi:hypothetical protein